MPLRKSVVRGPVTARSAKSPFHTLVIVTGSPPQSSSIRAFITHLPRWSEPRHLAPPPPLSSYTPSGSKKVSSAQSVCVYTGTPAEHVCVGTGATASGDATAPAAALKLLTHWQTPSRSTVK